MVWGDADGVGIPGEGVTEALVCANESAHKRVRRHQINTSRIL
jgi:hypothetical protein